MAAKENDYYQEFNNFQTAFYTDLKKFDDYALFDFKKHGYILLNNLAKGFPNLSNIIINLKGFNWDGATSPEVLKALQRKFVNGFHRPSLPQFIYFKNFKEEKSKEKVKETKFGLIFSSDIKAQICSILMIDSKTYDYLKYSSKIQDLGRQINGEFMKKEKVTKQIRKKK